MQQNLRKATWADSPEFAQKTDLSSLTTDVDKLETDKIKIVSDDLNNLKSKVNKIDINKIKQFPSTLKTQSCCRRRCY